MKQIRFNAGLLMWSFMLVILSLNASAQENSAAITQEKDITAPVKDESPHSLYAGLGYGSNMIYMGSNVSQDKPFYYGSLTYGYNNEFFVSVSTNHLSAFDPFLSFSAFSMSYNHDFNSWFDISLGVSRYQVNNELTDTLFSNFFYGYLTLGFDWNILYTSISAGGLFSEANSAYFQLKNSRYFETPAFMNGKAYLSCDPYVNLLFGTLTKTITADGTSIGVLPPFRPSKSSGQHSSATSTTFFGLMEVDLGLPVAFTTGKLTIEAEPGYVIPLYSKTDILNPKGFILLLNCYFRIL